MEFASTPESKVYEVDHTLFGTDLTITKHRLTNGLKIIVLEDHTAPVFAYHTWFSVGSRNEREGITGIAHLFEHLMFKETSNRKEGEFDRILEEQGGRINASTFVDWTFYTTELPREAFSLLPPLEADRMQNVILNETQVNAEREVVANERRMRVDNSPSGLMDEALFSTAYKAFPYRWPVIGWMKDIKAITVADCLKFYRTYYSPNNATIVVVGDVETADVLRRINEAYGHIPSAEIPPENLTPEPKQTEERRVELQQPIPAEKLLIGYHIPDAHHADYPAIEILNSVLLDGKSSRLFRALVTDGEIATTASGAVYNLRDPGLHVFDISMRSGHTTKEAETITYAELERLTREEVPSAELDKVKTRIEASFWRNFKSAGNKARGLGYYETVAGDYRKLFDEVPSFQRVTAADVRRVAKTYFAPTNRTVVTARPQSSRKP